MPEQNKYSLIVEPDDDQMRLDQFLASMLTAQSRSYLHKIIKQGNVLVNGRRQKAANRVKTDDRVEVELPEPIPLDVAPEEIPLEVLYEDEYLLVLNKQAGMVVHPGAGCLQHTLVNALLHYCGEQLSGIGGVLRPGIVHRLDKDTSGCLVVAKDDRTHRELARQFHDRQVEKEYLALVSGWLKEMQGELSAAIGRHPKHRKRMTVLREDGREAFTAYNVIERYEKAGLVSLRPGTGRTHQLRVHMAHLGYPILGDQEYGKRRAHLPGREIPRQMLHAYKLAFHHPGKDEWQEFTAPLPEDMESVLEYLRGETVR